MATRLRLRRFVFRAVVGLLLLAGCGICYLHIFGVPGAVLNAIKRNMDSKGYYLETKGIYLDMFRGIRMERTRVYKKGLVGPPLVEAEQVFVSLDIIRRGKNMGRLRAVEVNNGKIRRDANWSDVFGWAGGGRTVTDGRTHVNVSLHNCDIQGLIAQDLSLNVRKSSGVLALNDIDGIIGNGPLRGRLWGRMIFGKDGIYRARLSANLDPNELLVLLEAREWFGMARLIRTFTFEETAPLMEADFWGRGGDDPHMTLVGRVLCRNFRHKGIDVSSARAHLHIEHSISEFIVTLDPLEIERPEGSADVAFSVDLRNDTVTFTGTSTLEPHAAAQLINLRGPDYIKEFDFYGPLRASAVGRVSTINEWDCNIDATISAEKVGLTGLVADRCSLQIKRSGKVTRVTDLEMSLYDGSVKGSAYFFPDRASTTTLYSVDCSIVKADFRKFAEAVFNVTEAKEGYVGFFSAELDVTGEAARGLAGATSGRGSFRINNGNILRIPLFGGLSDLLVRVVPGLGYVLKQSDAYGDFEISEGLASTKEFRIEGDIISLKADGSYDLPSKALDFSVELRFLKRKTFAGEVLQTIMLPVTKLFRVKLTGAPSAAKWESVNF